jgi:hypothetical protein
VDSGTEAILPSQRQFSPHLFSSISILSQSSIPYISANFLKILPKMESICENQETRSNNRGYGGYFKLTAHNFNMAPQSGDIHIRPFFHWQWPAAGYPGLRQTFLGILGEAPGIPQFVKGKLFECLPHRLVNTRPGLRAHPFFQFRKLLCHFLFLSFSKMVRHRKDGRLLFFVSL